MTAIGHGRATELFLAGAALVNGLLLVIVPQATLDSVVVADLAWFGLDYWVAVAFFAKAILTGSGVLLNIAGFVHSRHLRFAGATLGSFMWSFYMWKLIALGAYTVPSLGFLSMALVFSARTIALALADLPRPGAPGVL